MRREVSWPGLRRNLTFKLDGARRDIFFGQVIGTNLCTGEAALHNGRNHLAVVHAIEQLFHLVWPGLVGIKLDRDAMCLLWDAAPPRALSADAIGGRPRKRAAAVIEVAPAPAQPSACDFGHVGRGRVAHLDEPPRRARVDSPSPPALVDGGAGKVWRFARSLCERSCHHHKQPRQRARCAHAGKNGAHRRPAYNKPVRGACS